MATTSTNGTAAARKPITVEYDPQNIQVKHVGEQGGLGYTPYNPTGTIKPLDNPNAEKLKTYVNNIKSQEGGNGNASTNPYSNAYETYKTNMDKVKESQIGQLNTEYNQQQKQIEGAYQGLNRNAYVTYMKRNLANRNAASNMGVNNSGMAENMQTANAVDYNRSVGNVGAYRVNQMSNAENAHNANVAGVEQEHASDLANMQNQYALAEIARQNELEDLRSQQEFQAGENAKDREQSAKESERAYQQQRYQDSFKVFSETIDGWSTKRINNYIKSLQKKYKQGKLTGWQKEYYHEIIMSLRAQRAQNKRNK